VLKIRRAHDAVFQVALCLRQLCPTKKHAPCNMLSQDVALVSARMTQAHLQRTEGITA